MTPDEPLPCRLCGQIPEVYPGLSDVPDTAGFVSCQTIWIGQARCPASADSVEIWNVIMAPANRDLETSKTQESKKPRP